MALAFPVSSYFCGCLFVRCHSCHIPIFLPYISSAAFRIDVIFNIIIKNFCITSLIFILALRSSVTHMSRLVFIRFISCNLFFPLLYFVSGFSPFCFFFFLIFLIPFVFSFLISRRNFYLVLCTYMSFFFSFNFNFLCVC